MGVSLTCFSWILTSDPRVCKSYLAFSRILTSGVSKEVFLDFLDFLDYRILTFSSVDHIYFYWILTYGPFVGSFFYRIPTFELTLHLLATCVFRLRDSKPGGVPSKV